MDLIRSRIKVFSGISGEIVIEISAADHIIALLVFRFQIGEEHLHLGVALGGVGSVRGSVKVDQYQLFSVLDRYTGNAVSRSRIFLKSVAIGRLLRREELILALLKVSSPELDAPCGFVRGYIRYAE